jgi:hypothetical protein
MPQAGEDELIEAFICFDQCVGEAHGVGHVDVVVHISGS